MRRQILPAEVRLRLYDHPRRGSVHHDFPQEIARHVDGRAVVEGPFQDRPGAHVPPLYNEAVRLFVGLDLPAEAVRNLERLLDELRPSAKIAWSPPANLHITTKFIGEWPEARLPEMIAALDGVPPREPIHVEIRGLGFFPRIFWCGVEAPGLDALAADTDR